MSHHVWRGRLQSPLYSLCLVGLRDDWGEHDLKKRFLNFFLLENEFGVMTICRTACKQPQVPAPLFTAAWRVLNSTELGVPPSNIFFTSLLVSFGEHNSLVHPHQCVSVLFFDWSKQLDLSGKKEKSLKRVFYTICSAPNSINVKTVTMSWKIWQQCVLRNAVSNAATFTQQNPSNHSVGCIVIGLFSTVNSVNVSF